jgi:perosamine synthetase
MIPYSRQFIDSEDIKAVEAVLKSDYLTTGPKVQEFEEAFASYCGSEYAVSFSSGTAALHACMSILRLEPGDEVIVPTMTFAATANCVVYMRATPVFADVDSLTLLIHPGSVQRKITAKTRAIIGVDYAGQLCDWETLRTIARQNNIWLIADSCHALGAHHEGRRAGAWADLTAFSFHPLKHITTGEGGMVTCRDQGIASALKRFRSHGINKDYHTRDLWQYDMISLGYNYRLSDIQCALGISQLRKLPKFLETRRRIARMYDEAFQGILEISPLEVHDFDEHAFHLYVVRVEYDSRERIFRQLQERGIGVCVHYKPVHLFSYYRQNFGTEEGMCPVAEWAYQEIISLPIHPGLDDMDVRRIIATVKGVL